MLLGVNYKNEYGIRRKAYNLDNPVCNAGLRIYSNHHQLRMELNYYVVPPELRLSFIP